MRIKISKHFLIVTGLLAFFCHFAVAQKKFYSWDFSDCEIKDILFAVSIDSGISIVPDDTVSGKGDLKFAGSDFSTAFETFLSGNRLFVKKEEGVWTVSRFRLRVEGELYFVDACDLQPHQILEKLSKEMEAVLSYDSLPAQKISVHFNGITEDVLMEALGKRFGSYDVLKGQTGYTFSKKIESRRLESTEGLCRIEKKENGFSIDIQDCPFSEVVEKLFNVKAGADDFRRDFCILSGGEAKLQRSVFNGKDFTDIFAKLCGQCGCDYIFSDGIYYIFANGNKKNELITGNRVWKKFLLSFTKSQDFFPLLYKAVGKLETISLSDETGFLCLASESESQKITDLITSLDIKQEIHPVNLKYIKPSELMSHLPPSVDKSALFVADDDSVLYFRGTESSWKNLQAQIELCDRPARLLRYDLLIMQYDDSSQNSWDISMGAGNMKLGDRNSLSAVLGSVMGFNLNVVTAFGITFAVRLQSSIEENHAKVFADTTLHGVSGKKINFQNTSTYRYRDNNLDPTTGKPIYSGITKEISSGIKLEIQGWVSGDGMITSTVTASLSRQGMDTSSKTGNPPPTTEKIVTTEVRGKSGEPLILSGLVLNADSYQQKRVPFLSKLPLLGNLFKSKETNSENSQVVIYLVPFLEEEKNPYEHKKYDKEWADQRIKDFTGRCNVRL